MVGNLTRDPEVKYTPSGMAVCEIGLAVSRNWTDKTSGTKKDETTFVDVTLWSRHAEIAGEYLAKGKPVLIEGRLSLDTWEDKATGQKRSKLKVVGETMQLLGGKGERTDKTAEVPSFDGGQQESFPLAGPSDVIPF